MSQRLYLSIDESNPDRPIACLHANGNVLRLGAQELTTLIKDVSWAAHTCHEIRTKTAPRQRALLFGAYT